MEENAEDKETWKSYKMMADNLLSLAANLPESLRQKALEDLRLRIPAEADTENPSSAGPCNAANDVPRRKRGRPRKAKVDDPAAAAPTIKTEPKENELELSPSAKTPSLVIRTRHQRHVELHGEKDLTLHGGFRSPAVAMMKAKSAEMDDEDVTNVKKNVRISHPQEKVKTSLDDPKRKQESDNCEETLNKRACDANAELNNPPESGNVESLSEEQANKVIVVSSTIVPAIPKIHQPQIRINKCMPRLDGAVLNTVKSLPEGKDMKTRQENDRELSPKKLLAPKQKEPIVHKPSQVVIIRSVRSQGPPTEGEKSTELNTGSITCRSSGDSLEVVSELQTDESGASAHGPSGDNDCPDEQPDMYPVEEVAVYGPKRRGRKPKGPAHYVCPECSRGFRTRDLFRDHLKVHKKAYKCEVCGRKFGFKHKYDSHMEVHRSGNFYKCPHCANFVRGKDRWEEHINVRHPGLGLSIPSNVTNCSTEFESRKDTTTPVGPVIMAESGPMFVAQKLKSPTANSTEEVHGPILLHDPASLDNPILDNVMVVDNLSSLTQEVVVSQDNSTENDIPKSLGDNQLIADNSTSVDVNPSTEDTTLLENPCVDEPTLPNNPLSLSNKSPLDNPSSHNNLSSLEQISTTDNLSTLDNPLKKTHLTNNGEVSSEKTLSKFTTSIPKRSKIRKNSMSHECVECKQVFRSGTKLQQHQKVVHAKVPTLCPICNRRFYYISSYDAHIDEHDKGLLVQCSHPECTFHYKSDTERDRHERRVHKNDAPRLHVCSECGKSFWEERYLKQHLQNHDKSKKYRCETCMFETYNMLSLRRHLVTKHDMTIAHVCDLCGAKLRSKSTLQDHLKRHFNQKSAVCVVCGKVFTNRSELGMHMRTHRRPEYMCSICGKESKTRSKMLNHMMIHAKLKPYPCSVAYCNYRCRVKHNLYKHMERVHKVQHPDKYKKYQYVQNINNLANIQAPGVQEETGDSMQDMYICAFKDCNYRASTESAVTKHQIRVHTLSPQQVEDNEEVTDDVPFNLTDLQMGSLPAEIQETFETVNIPVPVEEISEQTEAAHTLARLQSALIVKSEDSPLQEIETYEVNMSKNDVETESLHMDELQLIGIPEESGTEAQVSYIQMEDNSIQSLVSIPETTDDSVQYIQFEDGTIQKMDSNQSESDVQYQYIHMDNDSQMTIEDETTDTRPMYIVKVEDQVEENPVMIDANYLEMFAKSNAINLVPGTVLMNENGSVLKVVE